MTLTVACSNLPSPGWGGAIPTSGTVGDSVSPKIRYNTSAQTVSCTFTATNIIGQTTTRTITANFVMPPPPTANIWFNPPTIRAGESSNVNYSSTNSVYTGIVCSGVGYVNAAVVTPNVSWYWFAQPYSTAGVQTCGIHAYNQAGVLTWKNVDLVILPAATPPSAVTGGGASSSNTLDWPSGGESGPGAGDSGCGTGDSCGPD